MLASRGRKQLSEFVAKVFMHLTNRFLVCVVSRCITSSSRSFSWTSISSVIRLGDTARNPVLKLYLPVVSKMSPGDVFESLHQDFFCPVYIPIRSWDILYIALYEEWYLITPFHVCLSSHLQRVPTSIISPSTCGRELS